MIVQVEKFIIVDFIKYINLKQEKRIYFLFLNMAQQKKHLIQEQKLKL